MLKEMIEMIGLKLGIGINGKKAELEMEELIKIIIVVVLLVLIVTNLLMILLSVLVLPIQLLEKLKYNR